MEVIGFVFAAIVFSGGITIAILVSDGAFIRRDRNE